MNRNESRDPESAGALTAVKERAVRKVAPADIGNPETHKQQAQYLERIIRDGPPRGSRSRRSLRHRGRSVLIGPQTDA